MKEFKDFLYNKNSLLVLSYISKNIYKENTIRNMARELEISVGSVHNIINTFQNNGLVTSRVIGKSIVFNIDKQNPIFKQFRIFDNIVDMYEIVEKLKKISRKIILFGSCAKGEDVDNSDIDLFIYTDEEDSKINNIIKKSNLDREINPVIVDTIELMEMEEHDKTFYNEITKGIILWEE